METINVSKHTFHFHWPSRARPKAAKAITPEFRLPRPSVEPLYISSNYTLPLFHTSQPPLSRWQFFKSKSWGQHAYGRTNHICTPRGDGRQLYTMSKQTVTQGHSSRQNVISRGEGACANAEPPKQKLRSQVIHIWDNCRGQPNLCAMEGSHPRETTFMIMVYPPTR